MAQAAFSWRLWRLQREIEQGRKRTTVYVALELRDCNVVCLRFENASPIGIMLSKVALVAKANGRTADHPMNLDFHFAIKEYGSHEALAGREIIDAVRAVEAANPAWQGSQTHTAFVELTPHYEVEGKSRIGFSARYQLEFAGQNLGQILLLGPENPAGKW